MRRITKGPEPASLTQYRQTPSADYEGYRDKDALRVSLVNEQRGLCCYCLSRIRPESQRMKIAHWHSQTKYPREQLAYANLLGACLGNQGLRPKDQHCDTRQGNDDLSRNPANSDHQIDSFIRFEGDGQITSQDQIFDKEINQVLNLNLAFLKRERKAVLDSFQITLKKRGMLKRATLERLFRDWNGESGGELRPYCQVIVYWLRKRLARP
jgi:uncharacterized protein (TIGR02646 family)